MIKLLIVDDSKINRLFAKDTILSHHIPCEIEMCATGTEALEMINQHTFDLVLLDIIMPGMTGVEILEKLKEKPPKKMPKIVMLTNINNLNTMKLCFELGASDYIHKPFNDIEFTARLTSIIREIDSDNENLENLLVIEKQNEELVKVNESLKEAQYYLLQKEKLVAIGELAAGIAHEINNPLAFVMSNFDMIQRYILDLTPIFEKVKTLTGDMPLEAKQAIIKEIDVIWKEEDIDFVIADLPGIFEDSERGLKRVAKIVKSMRNFARVSEEDVYEYVDIGEIIDETLLIVNNEVKYTAAINKSIGSGPLIYCNKGQIEQVLVNILVNAAQAIKMKEIEGLGEIGLAVNISTTHCEITISDNGIGIDQNHLNRIFEPFFTTKPVGQGTGLGLSISYDIIVNKHHGTLDVKSKKNVGSEFIIRIPILTKEVGDIT
jgi:signal transduction histidine kinase